MPEFLKNPIMLYVVYPVLAIALVHRMGVTMVDPATYVPQIAGIEDTIAFPENLLGGVALPSGDFTPLPSIGGGASNSAPSSSAAPLPQVNNASQPLPQVESGGGCIVTVQAGQNLFRIGLAHGKSVRQLQNLNNIGNPNLISVGQKIRVC